MEHERYVTREELFAAHQRLADKTTKRADDLRKLTRFLNYGYDKYTTEKSSTHSNGSDGFGRNNNGQSL